MNIESFKDTYDLKMWESYIANEYIDKQEAAKTKKTKKAYPSYKVGLFNSKLDDGLERREELQQKLNDLEKKVDSILSILSRNSNYRNSEYLNLETNISEA